MNDAEREAAFMKRSYPEHLKFARRTATTFGIMAIVALISIVFAFFQREALQRRDVQLQQCVEQLEAYKSRAEKAELESLSANQKLEEALNAVHEAQRYTEEEYGKAWELNKTSTKRK